MNNIRAAITGVGHYVPETILDNKYFEKIVDTTDEWIVQRTGIRERRRIDDGATSDLGAGAVKDLMNRTGLRPEEIDLIICATVTPDMFFPMTAALIQHKIGATKAWGFDLSAACSGFVFALTTAAQFIENGTAKKVVLVGADKMTSIVDYTDRTTCVLFGDAGGAVLLEPSSDPDFGILDHKLYVDGSGFEGLHMLGGGSLNPPSHETIDKRMHYIYQDGKAVFKVAVKGMADVSAEILERNNLTGNDIDWLVPHQANLRIIDATAKRMNLDPARVMINIERYGNTTAATIPLCLSEWQASGKLKEGHRCVLAAFGAGYTWGASLIRWAY